MRYSILVLSLMLLPFSSFSQRSFQYHKVTRVVGGSDNFSIDKKQCTLTTGDIAFKNGHLIVNGNRFQLKEGRNNIYRIKAGFVRLFYTDKKELAKVQVTKFNTSYIYEILPEEAVIASK